MDEGEPFYPIPTPRKLGAVPKVQGQGGIGVPGRHLSWGVWGSTSTPPNAPERWRPGTPMPPWTRTCVEKALKALDKLLDTLQTRVRQLTRLRYHPSLHRYAIHVL